MGALRDLSRLLLRSYRCQVDGITPTVLGRCMGNVIPGLAFGLVRLHDSRHPINV